jgi:hypothetical protein
MDIFVQLPTFLSLSGAISRIFPSATATIPLPISLLGSLKNIKNIIEINNDITKIKRITYFICLFA